MYYVKDIESIGGLFIKEKILKKGFRYEIVKCLLYIQGEKFQVELQEFKKGKGIILDVVAETEEERELKLEKLDSIVAKYRVLENSPMAHYRRERMEVRMKTSLLRIMNGILLLQNLIKFTKLEQRGILFTEQGLLVILSLVVGTILLFVIESLRSRYIRG